MGLTVRRLPGEFAVCRLGPDAPIPAWAAAGEFQSITRTADELSVVCAAHLVPAGIRHESAWSLFQLAGPLPFTATGIIASVVGPLANAGISVFTMATFDTDYLLIKTSVVSDAAKTLEKAGHKVIVTEV